MRFAAARPAMLRDFSRTLYPSCAQTVVRTPGFKGSNESAMADQPLAFAVKTSKLGRLLFLVLFLLGTPLSVKPLLDSLSATPFSGLLGLVQVAIQVLALVLLFSSDGRACFKRRTS